MDLYYKAYLGTFQSGLNTGVALFQGFRLEGVHCKAELIKFVARLKVKYKFMTMCQKKLPPLFRVISSSRKGLKMTSAQLLSKKPRFELTLKLKSDMIDEAIKQGFKPHIAQRTLSITMSSQVS